MFAKIAVVISTLSVLAAAMPTGSSVSQCNTGSAQCCNSVTSASQPSTAALLGLLGVVVEGVTAQIGLNCSPILGVLGGGASCAQTPVCCQGNTFNGLVNVGCSPLSL